MCSLVDDEESKKEEKEVDLVPEHYTDIALSLK